MQIVLKNLLTGQLQGNCSVPLGEDASSFIDLHSRLLHVHDYEGCLKVDQMCDKM
jgi:hypothetical protein